MGREDTAPGDDNQLDHLCPILRLHLVPRVPQLLLAVPLHLDGFFGDLPFG